MIRQQRAGLAGILDRAAGALARAAARVARCLVAWNELHHQRRALLEMDERTLKDIGLRREDALREAHRLRWRFDGENLGPKR